jgi:hypothetical protein
VKGAFDWPSETLRASVDVHVRVAGEGRSTVALDVNVKSLTVKAVRGGGAAELPFAVGAGDEQGDAKLRVDVRPLGLGEGAAAVVRVEYEAKPYVAMAAVPVRAGDPATGRVVYTASEPLGAAEWMPCHNDPSDRARFAIELEVPPGEALVANGRVTADEALAGGARRVRYETAYGLPTYLMAFALGGLEAERAPGAGLPLAVWHRRGTYGDYGGVLAELARLVPLYEQRLGRPFPFEKYEVVLLPEFRFGGLENAGLTFQREESSTNANNVFGDLSLLAHELAHQWFGDLVTVATWDDVWVKEGMATLLEREGTRAYVDESGAGTLNGDFGFVRDGEAVRDPALAPRDKYNSGPYDRSAWLLTQVRSLAGEGAFWAALKRVLDEHAFGAVSGEQFLEAFRPALGDEALGRVKAALGAHAAYAVRVEAPAAAGAGPRVRLDDPEGSLVAPVRVAWVAPEGAAREQQLGAEPVELKPAGGELLVIDPADVHPAWQAWRDEGGASAAFDDTAAYGEHVAPLRGPAEASQNERFLALAGVHQLAAYDDGTRPPLEPAGLLAFLDALDTPPAEGAALAQACERAAGGETGWDPFLSRALAERPNYAATFVDRRACAAAVNVGQVFQDDWAALQLGPADRTISDARRAFLASLTTGLSSYEALLFWRGVVANGYSARARRDGAQALRAFVRANGDELAGAEGAEWLTWATGAAPKALGDVLRPVAEVMVRTRTAYPAGTTAAVSALVAAMNSSGGRSVVGARSATCGAYILTSNDAGAWAAFVAKVRAATLSPPVRAVVEGVVSDPDACFGYFGLPSGGRSGAAAAARPAKAGRPGPARAALDPAERGETKGAALGRGAP